MKQSETIGELAGALAKAQSIMGNAAKKSNNPFFKSKYADLAEVIETIREPLSSNNLSYTQLVDVLESGQMVLTTTLMHSSGEWQSSCYPLNPVKKDPQGEGSAISYARRYGLSAMVGVAQEDDDGNAASKTQAPKVSIPAKEKNQVYEQTLVCLGNGDEHGLKEIWEPYDIDHRAVLWGSFNSEQRSSIKKLMKGE